MSLQPYVHRISALQHGRYFSAAAFPSIKRKQELPPFVPREELKISKVNNLNVASVETNQPLSTIAIFFSAGSRHETDATQGVSHILRISAGLGTKGASQFGLTRNVEAAGGNIRCTGSREYIAYTLEAIREKLTTVDRYLQDVAVNQAFKPWELMDNLPRARLDRRLRSLEVRTLELIHKAAFRKGLGYSLYTPKWMLGNHSPEMLENYVKQNFVEASVVGVGMPHEQAVDFASRLNLKATGSRTTTNPPAPAKFHPGSDLRKETGNPRSYIALAVQGVGLGDPKKATAAALVHRALGCSPRIAGGLCPSSKLFPAVGDANTATKASAVGFSASYSDSGLVGVLISATPKTADLLTRKSAEILRSAKFSAEDAKRAKGILKGDIFLAAESGSSLVEYLGLSSLGGKALSLAERISMVDSVSAEDMNAVLSGGGGKLSMAVFGNVASVPYLDEL